MARLQSREEQEELVGRVTSLASQLDDARKEAASLAAQLDEAKATAGLVRGGEGGGQCRARALPTRLAAPAWQRCGASNAPHPTPPTHPPHPTLPPPTPPPQTHTSQRSPPVPAVQVADLEAQLAASSAARRSLVERFAQFESLVRLTVGRCRHAYVCVLGSVLCALWFLSDLVPVPAPAYCRQQGCGRHTPGGPARLPLSWNYPASA